jgi:NitT/TauT family transport system permease protein
MKKVLGYIWGTVCVLVLWGVLAAVLATPALPGPIEACQRLVQDWSRIAPQAGLSFWRLFAGLLAGTVVGVPVGLVLGLSKRVDLVAGPVLYILYPLPKIVFLPVFFVLLGIGTEPKVALIAVAVFFQTVVSMRDGARAIDVSVIEAARTLGAKRGYILSRVVFPACLPWLFSALRASTAISVAILFIAESMAGSTGLGYFIMHSWSLLEYSRMFAGIIVFAIMGVVIYEAFDIAEKKLARGRHVA